MEKKICQSCGMPLVSDNELGTNKDGSLNTDYCKYCFKDGEFILDKALDNNVIEKMIIKNKLKDSTISDFIFKKIPGDIQDISEIMDQGSDALKVFKKEIEDEMKKQFVETEEIQKVIDYLFNDSDFISLIKTIESDVNNGVINNNQKAIEDKIKDILG